MTDTTEAERFADWFRQNYPGPDTIIGRPDWHAPRIYRVATHGMQKRLNTVTTERDGWRDMARRHAHRIEELVAERDALRQACNQARLALAGHVSAQSAVDWLDAVMGKPNP